MRVIVTGGAGFIGSHIVKILIDKGHEVRVIDNLSRGFKNLVDSRADLQIEDLKNQDNITSLLQGYSAVIHLGNYIVVPESVDKAVEYTENNVVNTVKLLEAMKDAGVKKMIFSSSAKYTAAFDVMTRASLSTLTCPVASIFVTAPPSSL